MLQPRSALPVTCFVHQQEAELVAQDSNRERTTQGQALRQRANLRFVFAVQFLRFSFCGSVSPETTASVASRGLPLLLYCSALLLYTMFSGFFVPWTHPGPTQRTQWSLASTLGVLYRAYRCTYVCGPTRCDTKDSMVCTLVLTEVGSIRMLKMTPHSSHLYAHVHMCLL